ncbi:hypothetical protein BRADI_1g30480v3 [Brachypodium distachyon]|uniref:WRC domain-containing protein n=1 Tax=Brachypodium distachyon TaxID=15368 RepID=I1GVF2_BRADI|nr:hypothetical protein BRADI_1g30480v3 [Brachypodium distachyon]
MLESEEDKGVDAGGAERVWMCKNNDGRRWLYKRTLSEPNSLCSYHADQKRAAAPPAPPPAVSKTTKISKPAQPLPKLAGAGSIRLLIHFEAQTAQCFDLARIRRLGDERLSTGHGLGAWEAGSKTKHAIHRLDREA